ncbi:MAG: hypothetical protein AAFQ28_15175, partial [Pseudomonadota bacterium]
MNALIAKSAMDRRMAEIITPVIEDMGFDLQRLALSAHQPHAHQLKPHILNDGGYDFSQSAVHRRFCNEVVHVVSKANTGTKKRASGP